MKASVQITNGASAPAAGATETVRVDDDTILWSSCVRAIEIKQYGFYQRSGIIIMVFLFCSGPSYTKGVIPGPVQDPLLGVGLRERMSGWILGRFVVGLHYTRIGSSHTSTSAALAGNLYASLTFQLFPLSDFRFSPDIVVGEETQFQKLPRCRCEAGGAATSRSISLEYPEVIFFISLRRH
ncbi:hypothetical protein EVAR_56973_1 [Eumeta japonica]|uniref:Uncharacterized protein n=1 Tax=Eumeta variegata TaxID=151549 RepID=A0A4C1ZBH4_EUMVA|nr:hypothetical protein EVAR_56973_1 [Eumeta japonica]